MPIVPRITRSQPNENLEGFLTTSATDPTVRDVIESPPDPGDPDRAYQVTFQPGDYTGISSVEVPAWVHVTVLPGARFAEDAFTGATDNVVDLNRLAAGSLGIPEDLTVEGKLTVRNRTPAGDTSVFERNLEVLGDLDVGGNLTARSLTETSTARLKKDVEPLPDDLAGVLRLRPVSFTWKDGGGRDTGLVAEEVFAVFPDAVTLDDEGRPAGVRYGRLVVRLIGALRAVLGDESTM